MSMRDNFQRLLYMYRPATRAKLIKTNKVGLPVVNYEVWKTLPKNIGRVPMNRVFNKKLGLLEKKDPRATHPMFEYGMRDKITFAIISAHCLYISFIALANGRRASRSNDFDQEMYLVNGGPGQGLYPYMLTTFLARYVFSHRGTVDDPYYSDDPDYVYM